MNDTRIHWHLRKQGPACLHGRSIRISVSSTLKFIASGRALGQWRGTGISVEFQQPHPHQTTTI